MSYQAIPNGCSVLQGESPFTVQAFECPGCGGELLLFVGQFAAWEECLSCDQSSLVAWTSWQPGLVPGAGLPSIPGWVVSALTEQGYSAT